jgi:hypothetical protein
MTALKNMAPADFAMLICGVILFVVTLALLVYCMIKRQPLAGVITLFFVSIIMIGYPSITTINAPGGLSIKKTADDFENNPNNGETLTNFALALNQLPGQISPQVRSNLIATVNTVAARRDLSAQSQQTLAHAQLILGLTNQAIQRVREAMKLDKNLVLDQRFEALINREAPVARTPL